MRLYPELTGNLALVEQLLPDGYAESLWKELLDEYSNPEFILKRHNQNRYAEGCRGPMCKKEVRDARRQGENNEGRSQTFLEDMILMFFAEKIVTVQDELLADFKSSLGSQINDKALVS
jgi:hypothetical protein